MITDITVGTKDAYFLAEGPLWDPIRERLLWVDIRTGRAFSGELLRDGSIRVVETVRFDDTVGAVGVSAVGGWIVAGHNHILFRTPDGQVHEGPRILPESSGSRLNDGKADPAGRYLVGTLSLAGPSETESLVAIDSDGKIAKIDDDLTLSNGLAWSADGRTLYSIDTERQVVYRRSYESDTGRTGPRDSFISFNEGYPDGMTIDADGHLWIAVWGLGQVQRFSPSGDLVHTIRIPTPHTSSVAFAGPDLDTLVITTAIQDLSNSQLADHPLSGHIFTTRPGVRGLPQPLWSGLPTPATK
ncbi:SMP-30/gluconolactonase/LRE family protein [Leifsonia sp. 2MCAF36]|uniref:SMP-30/gluconolactonase/LRE family protein n=1 Tax=Leifsonia sp. 2MCAF36 TaxID=3232988 RepID=UPI003F9C2C1F